MGDRESVHRHGRGDREKAMSQNGKGSKRRLGDEIAYRDGWDRIFRKAALVPGYCPICSRPNHLPHRVGDSAYCTCPKPATGAISAESS